MEVKDLKALIEALDRSSLSELSFSHQDGTKVTLRRNAPVVAVAGTPTYAPAPVQALPAPAPAAAPAAAPVSKSDTTDASGLLEIKSPMVGTFYRTPNPDAAPFVTEGSAVSKGQTVCIVEAMKLMNEIESDVTGTIVKVCLENEAPVEFGTVLYLVKP
jgi:acetyl-CoA carboxylase biotin carboxyl carrier protein